jgi:hypothetical protein
MMLKGKVLNVHLSTRNHRWDTGCSRTSSHNFNLWPTKCNGMSCMHFPFQVFSLAMVHFLHCLSHIPPVVVFWREVGTFFGLPKTVAIKWDSSLWCSKTVWSKLQAFHWFTQQALYCSSLIGPHHTPKWNACLKVKRYNIGEDSSDGENKCCFQFRWMCI